MDGSRCELLPSGPPTPWWSGFAATRFPHRRDGGDLSYEGRFPKSDIHGGEPEERTVDGDSSICRPVAMEAICLARAVFRSRTQNGGVGGSQAVDGGVKSMPLEKLLSA